VTGEERSRVLVTGAGGFLGSALCARLHATGAQVHGAGRHPPPVEVPCARWWTADLAEGGIAEELIAAIRPHTVFHLAGEVTGRREPGVLLPTYHANLTSTVNLLAAATAVGCGRLVLAGSLEEPDSADVLATPSSPYAASKWAASAYARMCYALYDTPVVIARIFMVYGPRQRNAHKLIPYVITSLLRGEAPALAGGGREIDWIYIDDVVSGLLALAAADALVGETVDLGSGQPVTVRTLVEALVRITGSAARPVFGALQERPMEQVRRADTGSTFTRLGWRPTVALEQGLAHTVAWYAAHVGERASAMVKDLA